jgi:nucleoside-diphosphate-sugar epimerase
MVGCDVVVHAAAYLDFWGDPERFEEVNVHGTQHVVDAARAVGVTRLVYLSAAAVVLGGGDVGGADESWPRQLAKHCAYSRTKAKAEAIVLAANRDGFTTLAIRPPMIWGAGDPATLPRLKEAMNTRRFAWINGGRNRYSTCHVDNVAEAVVCALTKGVGGAAYFVTDGVERTYREVIESQLQAKYSELNSNPSVPRWVAVLAAATVEKLWGATTLSGTPPITRSLVNLTAYDLVVCDDRARRELGYQGATSVDCGLASLTRTGVAQDVGAPDSVDGPDRMSRPS